jgi:hypothetical protein
MGRELPDHCRSRRSGRPFWKWGDRVWCRLFPPGSRTIFLPLCATTARSAASGMPKPCHRVMVIPVRNAGPVDGMPCEIAWRQRARENGLPWCFSYAVLL